MNSQDQNSSQEKFSLNKLLSLISGKEEKDTIISDEYINNLWRESVKQYKAKYGNDPHDPHSASNNSTI